VEKFGSEIEPTRGAIDALGTPVVIEFGTSWCTHCIGAQPLIASALARHPQLAHIKIEDGPGRPLGRSFRVKLWPTLIFMQHGMEVERLVRPTDVDAIELACDLIDAAR
jgi:thioredoxin 1